MTTPAAPSPGDDLPGNLLDVASTEPGAHLHSMLGAFRHPDGRDCAHHQRLNEWIVMSDPRDPMLYSRPFTYRCLRSHESSDVGGALAGAV